MTIQNIRRNNVGTVSFEGQFKGQRKPQDFIVYPIKDAAQPITVQSATRIGFINLASGTVTLSGPKAGGAYSQHLNGAQIAGQLSAVELVLLGSAIRASADGKGRGVSVDNSAARELQLTV